MIFRNAKCDRFNVVLQELLNDCVTKDLSLWSGEFDGRMFERLFAVLKERFKETFRGLLFVISLNVLLVLIGAKTAGITAEPCAIGGADTVIKVVPRVGVNPSHDSSVCNDLIVVKADYFIVVYQTLRQNTEEGNKV